MIEVLGILKKFFFECIDDQAAANMLFEKAIELFDAEGVKRVNLHVVDLMQYENYSDIQDTLAKLTNRRTVPNIFVGSRNLGGTTEVEGMQLNGKLRGYLERAGALESA